MDLGAFLLYHSIVALIDILGRAIIPSDWPSLRWGPGGAWRLEPIHASWRFPASRDYDRAEHRHDVFHILAVCEGEGSFLIGGEETIAKAPQLFLVPPELPHSFGILKNEELVYHECTFALRGKGAPKNWVHLLNFLFPENRFAQGSEPLPWNLSLDPDTMERLGSAFQGIAAILAGMSPSWLLDAHIRMLAALAIEAAEHAPDKRSVLVREILDPLDAVFHYMELHFAERFSLTLPSKIAGLSEKHLCRAFKKRYGRTLFQVKRDQALKSAERLLSSTRYPLKHIAGMTGFSDEFHFSKAFKERYGVPPGEFRHRVSRSAST